MSTPLVISDLSQELTLWCVDMVIVLTVYFFRRRLALLLQVIQDSYLPVIGDW
jgi:hypothetical protein